MPDRTPVEERALTDAEATPWSTADERLANPERPRTYWLATVSVSAPPGTARAQPGPMYRPHVA